MNKTTVLHNNRLQLQRQLDATKTSEERNKLGQFATPPALAQAMAESTQTYLAPDSDVHFFDPAFGTGAFYTAVKQVYTDDQIKSASGIEIDPHYGKPSQVYWQSTNLKLTLADFTQLNAPDEKPNLIICNPPYVRHHHLDPQYKRSLGKQVENTTGIKLSGLSGLYCYFLLLSHQWMAQNGVGCWLIPNEFLDVNYGRQVKKFLLNNVSLLRIHRFDPTNTQFEDALISSTIVWFRNKRPNPDDRIEFSYGGTIDQPQKKRLFLQKQLDSQSKWSNLPFSSRVTQYEGSANGRLRLSNFFTVKRGIATGANKFFILTSEQIHKYQLPMEFFIPILPSPRYLNDSLILANNDGTPLIDKQLFLLNCNLPEIEIQTNYPTLWTYLEKGKQEKIHERYLCRHRSPWYAQEFRDPPPILCTYMGRSETPFKFILNQSKAVAANVYLMLYPKKHIVQQLKTQPELITQVWQLLKNLNSKELISEGRVYGGGLFKMEPKELGNVSLTGIEDFLPTTSNLNPQLALF